MASFYYKNYAKYTSFLEENSLICQNLKEIYCFLLSASIQLFAAHVLRMQLPCYVE